MIRRPVANNRPQKRGKFVNQAPQTRGKIVNVKDGNNKNIQKVRYCQCSPNCNNPPLDNSPFCAEHMNYCPRISPMTGYEPEFDPNAYNGDKAVQHSHNCFAYSMNVIDKKKVEKCRETENCDVPFHIPGKTAGHPGFSGSLGKTCSDVMARTMSDVPNSILINFEGKCPAGMSKVGVVVDKENDLHYYRQDSNGMWSHKPGGRPVTDIDASKVKIYDPSLADRNYPAEYKGDSGLNYADFCSYMCVPRIKPIALAGGKAGRKSRNRRTRRR